MITRLELNSLKDRWEAVVHMQTEHELETVAKFAEEQGLPKVVKLRNHVVCVMIPKELVSKFCDKFIGSRPNKTNNGYA